LFALARFRKRDLRCHVAPSAYGDVDGGVKLFPEIGVGAAPPENSGVDMVHGVDKVGVAPCLCLCSEVGAAPGVYSEVGADPGVYSEVSAAPDVYNEVEVGAVPFPDGGPDAAPPCNSDSFTDLW
jgi:hypothetical protein